MYPVFAWLQCGTNKINLSFHSFNHFRIIIINPEIYCITKKNGAVCYIWDQAETAGWSVPSNARVVVWNRAETTVTTGWKYQAIGCELNLKEKFGVNRGQSKDLQTSTNLSNMILIILLRSLCKVSLTGTDSKIYCLLGIFYHAITMVWSDSY